MKSKLTILKVLYARPHIGGSGRLGITLALELAKMGHNVHIVSYPNTYLTDEEAKFLTLHTISDVDYDCFKLPPTGLIFPSKIKEIAEKIGADILHAHYAITHGESIIQAKEILMFENKSNVPVTVITCHGTDITINGYNSAIGPALNYYLNVADGLTFVSNSLFEEAKRLFKLNLNSRVIYNFIDETVFDLKRIGSVLLLKKKYDIKKEDIVFYHVSNFRNVKNPLVMIKALNILVNKLNLRNIKLLLIGNGPLVIKCENLIRKFRLENNVIFTGSIPPEQVAQYSKLGDIFLLPSLKEAFGLVNLEAMHLKKPIIASNRGGISEVVEDGITGFIFNPKDFEELANLMLKFINNKHLILKMGNAGKKRANLFFNRTNISKQYVDFYYELLKKKNENFN